MSNNPKGAIDYEDTDGQTYHLNACELHGCTPVVKKGSSTQWGPHVTIQCPDCIGLYVPRAGAENDKTLETRSVMKQAADSWNFDNPVPSDFA